MLFIDELDCIKFINCIVSSAVSDSIMEMKLEYR